THGGFYRHFETKEDLFTEALVHALRESSDFLVDAAEGAPEGEKLKALIDAYLSREHCLDRSGGCPVAALVSEVGRRPAATRRGFQRAVREYVKRLSRYVPGGTEGERTQKAAVLFSGMSGVLGVARALEDEASRERLLAGARAFFLHAAQG